MSRLLQRVRKLVYRYRLMTLPFWLLARARVALGPLRPGVTVVIVNWNTEDYLRFTLQMVRRYSPGDVRIRVIDNASTSRVDELVRGFGGTTIRLPANVGHEPAMDLGFLLTRTTHVVALDVDAFPIAPDWIDQLIGALDAGNDVAGAHLRGGFVHACCLAMRTERFVRRRHSFTSRRGKGLAVSADEVGYQGWDTGNLISLREPRRHLVDRVEVRGPGDVGSVFGTLCYHNFYSARMSGQQKYPISDAEWATGLAVESPAIAWSEAVRRWGSHPCVGS